MAGISAGDRHTCAVTTTGRAYCWGDNTNGQVGDNTTGTTRLTPTAVNTTTGLTDHQRGRISSRRVQHLRAGNPTAGARATAGASTATARSATTPPAPTGSPPSSWPPPPSPPPPPPPTGLAGTSGGGTGQVPLTWTSVAGTDYQIQYRVNGSGGWTQTSWQTAATLTVTGLTNGTTYDFQVRGHNAGGYSAWSASVTATP